MAKNSFKILGLNMLIKTYIVTYSLKLKLSKIVLRHKNQIKSLKTAWKRHKNFFENIGTKMVYVSQIQKSCLTSCAKNVTCGNLLIVFLVQYRRQGFYVNLFRMTICCHDVTKVFCKFHGVTELNTARSSFVRRDVWNLFKMAAMHEMQSFMVGLYFKPRSETSSAAKSNTEKIIY